MASAISSISMSLPTPLRALQPHKTNLALSWAYPLLASIRSMLGEKGDGPRLPFIRKAMLVISQRPVHLARAHSSVSSKAMPRFAASACRDFNKYAQGLEDNNFARCF